MGQRSALPVLAALALTAFFGSLTLPAAGEVPGTIVTVAGTGTPGYSTKAQLQPGGPAFDGAGNLYITDWDNDRVQKIDVVTGIITTVAGTGQPGFSGDNGKATAAQLNRPANLVVDGAGNLFISDFYNHRVRKIDTVTGIITTYAGSGPVDKTTNLTAAPRGGFSGENGPATDARLNGPTALAVDARGNLFIADAYNQRVRKVSPEGVITTGAGTGADRSSGDNGLATEAGIAVAWGLAVDAGGGLFIAETGGEYDGPRGVLSNRGRRVDPITGIFTTVAGTGGEGAFSGEGGKATDARLNLPGGLAVDSAGTLFIADQGNYRVRKVGLDGIISTVAGNGKRPYAGDGGLATETGLRGPGVLAIDPVGNLLFSDADPFGESKGLPPEGRLLKVYGVAAPGLIAGMAFPQ